MFPTKASRVQNIKNSPFKRLSQNEHLAVASYPQLIVIIHGIKRDGFVSSDFHTFGLDTVLTHQPVCEILLTSSQTSSITHLVALASVSLLGVHGALMDTACLPVLRIWGFRQREYIHTQEKPKTVSKAAWVGYRAHFFSFSLPCTLRVVIRCLRGNQNGNLFALQD